MSETFENNGRFFIKSFLLDDTLNLNKWGVTKDAILQNLGSFVGKPFVITPGFNHPEAASGDELLETQEAFRVGNIIEVGFESETGRAFAISEITDDKAKDMLQKGEVNFVSPSIVFGDRDVAIDASSQNTIVTNFEGAHLAAVKDPAYGMQKAQIKGKCNGSAVDCKSQLAKVQAQTEPQVTYAGFPTLRECVEANLNVEDDPVGYCVAKREVSISESAQITNSKCGNYTKVDTGKAVYIIAQSDCVGNCLSKKKSEGKEIDDQAIAICLSECGESKEGVIDPESQENITTVPQIKCEPTKLKKTSSDKRKNDYSKAMTTTRNAQEEEEKKNEEEEGKKANEEKEEEEESKKGQEDDDKDDEMEALKKAIKDMKDELESLKSKAKKAAIEPIATEVLKAKQELGRVKEADKDAELEKLMKMDEETLVQLQAEYEKILETQNQPRYSIKYASVKNDTSDNKVYLDSVMEAMR